MLKLERCELEGFISDAGTTSAYDLVQKFRESGEDPDLKPGDILFVHSLTFSLARDRITAIYEVTLSNDTHTHIYLSKSGHNEPTISFTRPREEE
jgi:hypothetical protein